MEKYLVNRILATHWWVSETTSFPGITLESRTQLVHKKSVRFNEVFALSEVHKICR